VKVRILVKKPDKLPPNLFQRLDDLIANIIGSSHRQILKKLDLLQADVTIIKSILLVPPGGGGGDDQSQIDDATQKILESTTRLKASSDALKALVEAEQ